MWFMYPAHLAVFSLLVLTSPPHWSEKHAHRCTGTHAVGRYRALSNSVMQAGSRTLLYSHPITWSIQSFSDSSALRALCLRVLEINLWPDIWEKSNMHAAYFVTHQCPWQPQLDLSLNSWSPLGPGGACIWEALFSGKVTTFSVVNQLPATLLG